MKFDWRKTLAAVAPTLATALGGPMAGAAVGAISRGLMGREDASEEELEHLVSTADPATLAKLKQIDADFRKEMRKLDVDLARVNAEDRADARDMAQQTNLWPQIIIGAAFILGYFAILICDGALEAFEVDPLLLGVLTTGIPVILQFWFGSSSGSKAQSRRIAQKLLHDAE